MVSRHDKQSGCFRKLSIAFSAARLLLCGLLCALAGAAQAGTPRFEKSPPPASKDASADLRTQFQPSKDDDHGTDEQEAQELNYQWLDVRYSRNERTQIIGISAYFLVLCAGAGSSRIAAGKRMRGARL